MLRSLHWLPVPQRIDFKMALLDYMSFHGLAPKYISDMMEQYKSCRTLRTSGSGLLPVPRVRTKHGEAVFQFYAARAVDLFLSRTPETTGVRDPHTPRFPFKQQRKFASNIIC